MGASTSTTELQALMAMFYRYTNLPDVLDFLTDEDVMALPGERQFLTFLDRFGGMVLVIPPRERVAEAVRDLHIFRSLSAEPSRQNRERLATIYHLDLPQVRQSHARIRRLMEGQSEQFKFYLRRGPESVADVSDDRHGPGRLEEAPKKRRKRQP